MLYAFERNWKIVSLKRDNAVQNCKYINILLKAVHESFLSLKLLSAKVKRFFVISLSLSTEPEKASTRMKTKKTTMLISFKNTLCSKNRQTKHKNLFSI